MGRTVKDVRLQDRAARTRLPVSPDIYWRAINEGCHIGYYRGERGGKWVVRYRKPGGGKGYTKIRIGEADDVRDADGETVLDWKQAQAKAHEWFEDQARGGVKPAGPFTVAAALDEYTASVKARTGSIPTDMKSRVDEIIKPVLGHHEVANLTQKIIGDWHEARANSPAKLRTKRGAEKQNERTLDDKEASRKRRATANRDLTVLKAALNRAAESRDWMPIAAWAKVKPFKGVDVAKRRYLNDDEARRLVNASEPEFRPMVRAALLTGGRYGELRHAQVKDYDRESRTVYLVETKNAEPRPAYLDKDGVAMIETAVAGKKPGDFIFVRPDGTQWQRSQQLRRMNDAFDRAEIDKTTFHDLRRTYGARLARAGVPMAVIAEAMGHKDERITRKHYAHLAPSYVSETVRNAISGMGIVEPSNVKSIAS
ncbi:tyrosine-type recombinase/integrase [Sphingomonas paucimobilis]|uniref:Site-specific integrase n=1 Tax=Sphingomonas paucimobilis TaxID=13689 RepID=A0A7Y2PG33_SPHPI|nr:site-specific integrase [Sphingomonas paucimobilis]NNG59771.1 site-specific integrase [Sphingomonas paucimobilis]